MKQYYDPPMPRVALRLVAAGMTAITMCVLVALPAKLETASAATLALAHERTASGTPAAACIKALSCPLEPIGTTSGPAATANASLSRECSNG
ncbi:MAG: hypothetical protein ABI624_25645 [Casimicrobiaceae bacterium]